MEDYKRKREKYRRINEISYALLVMKREGKITTTQEERITDMVCSNDPEMVELGRKIALDLYFDNE